MKRLHFALLAVLLAAAANAQLKAPARELKPIADPSMVVDDRGASLEVYPTKRAYPEADATGRASTHRVVTMEVGAPIGPAQLAVVFNHAMQQQGYASGEITFKIKAGHSVSAVRAAGYPGMKRISKSGIYALYSRTPAEFVSLLKQLQKRPDLEWVEPTVVYGPERATSAGSSR